LLFIPVDDNKNKHVLSLPPKDDRKHNNKFRATAITATIEHNEGSTTLTTLFPTKLPHFLNNSHFVSAVMSRSRDMNIQEKRLATFNRKRRASASGAVNAPSGKWPLERPSPQMVGLFHRQIVFEQRRALIVSYSSLRLGFILTHPKPILIM
jgi:hypothetical protein